MADFVNKILLIATQFKSEMTEVTNHIKKNKEEIEKNKQKLKAFKDGMGRIAGAIGGIVAAYEIFDQTMKANADRARDWQATIYGAKLATNLFFAELSRGKFDNLNQGFLESISNAKEFYRILARAKSSLGILKTGNEEMEAKRNLYSNIINSPTATDAEIDKAYKNYMAIAEEEVQERDKQNSKIKKDIFKRLMPNFKAIKTPEQLIDLYQKYTNFFRDEYDKYEAYKKRQKDLDVESGESFSWDKMTENLTKNSTETYKSQQAAKKAKREEKNQLYEDIMVLEDLFHSDENLEPLLLEMMDAFNTNIDKKGSLDAERKGVIEDYEKRLEERKNRKKKIEDTEEEKVIVGSLNELYAKQADIKKQMQNTDLNNTSVLSVLRQEEKQVNKNIEALELYLKKLGMNKPEGADIEIGASTGLSLSTKEDADKLIKDKLSLGKGGSGDNEIADWAGTASEGVNGLASALGTLGGALGDSAAQWLNFVSTFAEGIAEMLPMLQSLITANTAAAASNAGKDASTIPWGWVTIPAILATVLGMFAALPKFASGGIFSTMGDFNLARMNNGEMILNNAQQRRLWNIINNGGVNNIAAANSQVEFKISGKELVGVIQNYNNKRSKVL